MYFLDPARGARRRALVRNKAVHVAKQERRFLQKGARDARHRGAGMLARLRTQRLGIPDIVLVERVRAELGRHVSHAGSIDVVAHNGLVTLRGPIFKDEVRGLLRATQGVRGVKAVENRLEPHEHDDRVPGLQGEGRVSRPIHRREHWPPAYRLAMSGAGLAAASFGLFRGGLLGRAIAAGGGALLLRAAMDRPLRKLLGIGQEPMVMVQRAITVSAPLEEVYGLWSRLENFPMFMEHVRRVEVEPDGVVSHWQVAGPGGAPLEWDAELVEKEPGERLTWRTLSGAVVHAGTVRFEVVDARTTRVHVRMAYSPPAGVVGHTIASLLGQDPGHALHRDLLRMKSLLQDGKAKIRGQTVVYTGAIGEPEPYPAG